MDKQFEEQLNAAMELFNKRDYENALEEIKKLPYHKMEGEDICLRRTLKKESLN